MSQLPLCPHCLEPVRSGYHGSCPNCGKSLENHNPEGALPLGTQLGGHYTVGEYQSADGDGLCYRGVDNDERRFVLIKEYFPVTLCNGRSPDGDLMPKEGREVLFKTSRMDFKDLYDDLHRITPATGLSQILDVMEENNTVYAVEETEKGMTLTHYLKLRARTLTPVEARTLLQPVMEGVALLHKAGLIHRGICPDNILLPIDGAARLTGYGTLALRTAGSELKSQLYPGYAAPEQYSAAEFSGRYTDVYALAAVTYRLVTGQVPVAAPQRKVRDSMENAHSLESGVPTYFSQVLTCAMRLDPAKRMQTVPELMSALTDPTVANAMFEKGENQVSTKKILAASMVVIFVLVVLLLWSLLKGGKGSDTKPAVSGAASTGTSASSTTNGDVEVYPDLVGKNYKTDIKNSTLYTHYRIAMTEDFSSTVPEGCVIRQEPVAGTLVTEQAPTIQLVVSKGPMLVEMPDIIGWTQNNASKKLDESGINYSMQIIENDGQYAENCVVKCDVNKGTRFDADETVVTVYIAGARNDAFAVDSSPTPSEQPNWADSADPAATAAP